MRRCRNSLVAGLVLATVLAAPGARARVQISGIPADANTEYLIFIIDNSGSMRRYEWDRVIATVRETLDRHPDLKGLQVLNDAGRNLFISYRNEWIPDTPANRAWILSELEDWGEFSTSNPGRGLLTALDTYSDPAKEIAIYVLGDDFSAGATSIEPLLRDVEQRNPTDESGAPLVRINTIAFPIYWDQIGAMGLGQTGGDFSNLMAALSQRNGGSFVALPTRLAQSPAPTPEAAGAERVLIVIDGSANMGGQLWRQAVDSVGWLLDGMAAGSSYQVMLLNEQSRSLIAGTEGQWQSHSDAALRERTMESLRNETPAGAVDLGAIRSVIDRLEPAPGSVYLLAAMDHALSRESLPEPLIEVPEGTSVDLLLFGCESNREAVPYYWSVALANRGSLVAPAYDWP